jgi:hypothetical protein
MTQKLLMKAMVLAFHSVETRRKTDLRVTTADILALRAGY